MGKVLSCVRAVKKLWFCTFLIIKNAVIRASVTLLVIVSLPLLLRDLMSQ